MRELLTNLLALLGGGAVVLVGIIGAAWYIVKTWGEKTISARFEHELAAYKHDQQKELEQIKFTITNLVDRATRLHTREFEVLPEAWSKLVGAYFEALSVVSPLQQYNDVDKFSDVQFERFLEKSDLPELHIDELRSASRPRQAVYTRLENLRRVRAAPFKLRDFALYIRKNGLFVLPDVRDQFRALEDLAWSALIELEVHEQYSIERRESVEQEKFRTDGDTILNKLETALRERMWDSKSALVSAVESKEKA